MKRTTPILASRYLRMPCVKKISPTAARMSTMLAGPAGAGAGEEDCQRLQATIQALSYLIELIGDQDTTISQLRALLVKPSTEKTSKVLEQAGLEASPKRSPPPPANAKPKSGHGRNGKCLSGPFLNLPFYSNAAKILPFQFAFV